MPPWIKGTNDHILPPSKNKIKFDLDIIMTPKHFPQTEINVNIWPEDMALGWENMLEK